MYYTNLISNDSIIFRPEDDLIFENLKFTG